MYKSVLVAATCTLWLTGCYITGKAQSDLFLDIQQTCAELGGVLVPSDTGWDCIQDEAIVDDDETPQTIQV